MQCILPYVQKGKERKLFLKANVIIMISLLFFCFLVGNWKWIHKLFSKYLQYKRSLAEWRILRMEEENNVIYSYVQAGDQNDGVVMSTGKAKSSLQNCAICWFRKELFWLYDLKSVHFKNTVARSSFLSKMW